LLNAAGILLRRLKLALIEINHLYKIFGPKPKDTLALLKKGEAKSEVLQNTRHTIALQDVSLEIEEG